MVAQIGGIVAQQVHRSDHWMQRPLPFPGLQRFGIAQGAALKEVAIINQKATTHLGPGLRDQAGSACQTHGGAGAVLQIIPRAQMRVQV